ncbi:unnamed protein product [Mytilus edulis]|uniref:Uncharacterized protein n=1 Tax=Mytilus edulis TaxID=6550 RepID=A0A8S3TAD1_MYTED|nr:unnamed protein product [Mytilus edulis]
MFLSNSDTSNCKQTIDTHFLPLVEGQHVLRIKQTHQISRGQHVLRITFRQGQIRQPLTGFLPLRGQIRQPLTPDFLPLVEGQHVLRTSHRHIRSGQPLTPDFLPLVEGQHVLRLHSRHIKSGNHSKTLTRGSACSKNHIDTSNQATIDTWLLTFSRGSACSKNHIDTSNQATSDTDFLPLVSGSACSKNHIDTSNQATIDT